MEGSMDRAKRLVDLWAYLPTFRFVAEIEHISHAAEGLGVTPSAISRSIAALEERVGQPLFRRRGRTLELNEAGRHLLAAVRSAMRRVDDGLEGLAEGRLVGDVRISTEEPYTRCRLPTLLSRLGALHPELRPNLLRIPGRHAVARLLDGTIDIAFTSTAIAKASVTARRVADFPTAVFASPDHPLSTRKRVSPADLATARFVDVSRQNGRVSAWPVDWGLTIEVAVDDYDLALTLAVEGGRLAVLPIALAASDEAAGRLKRLPTAATRSIPMWAVWREELDGASRAGVIAEMATEGSGNVGLGRAAL